jgi:hypothetical protein
MFFTKIKIRDHINLFSMMMLLSISVHFRAGLLESSTLTLKTCAGKSFTTLQRIIWVTKCKWG